MPKSKFVIEVSTEGDYTDGDLCECLETLLNYGKQYAKSCEPLPYVSAMISNISISDPRPE